MVGHVTEILLERVLGFWVTRVSFRAFEFGASGSHQGLALWGGGFVFLTQMYRP